ncbi:MAG: hypothetical protein LBC53_01895 [Spirochaetaceae bacterium]|nr:hypothetical protein [Spirochaetaceae bacterium]
MLFCAFILILAFSGCGAEINPDFEGFIKNELRKVHTMTYSVVDVKITLPPYRDVYEMGEAWAPVNPDNPEDGIEAAVTIGGGTVYPYYFESFNSQTNILTMKGEDGKSLSFRLDGFNTASEGSRRLRLTALNGAGEDLKTPVLPADYLWKFEREGETLFCDLDYKVVKLGGLDGDIGLSFYLGGFGGVYANVERFDIGEEIGGVVRAAPGYRLKDGGLKCVGAYLSGGMDIWVGEGVWKSEASWNGLEYPFSFKINAENMKMLCDVELFAAFEMEEYAMTLPAAAEGGRVIAVEVNETAYDAGEGGLFPVSLRMGDRVRLVMKADSGWVLSKDGVSYEADRFGSFTIPSGYTDASSGDSAGEFLCPASNIKVRVVFEDLTISYITASGYKSSYGLYDQFDGGGISVNGVMSDRNSQVVDLTDEAEFESGGWNNNAERHFDKPGKWEVIVRARGKMTVFVVNVSGEDFVAARTVGGARVFYKSVRAAIDAAAASGDASSTISLVSDVTVKNSAPYGPKEEAPVLIGGGVNVVINSSGGERTIKLADEFSGFIFKVESGASLTLEGGAGSLTLSGGAVWGPEAGGGGAVNQGFLSYGPLVRVEGGVFTLKDAVALRNNQYAGGDGGGVAILYGTFNMLGGVIESCAAPSGGGVYLIDGEFNFSGGEISGNFAANSGGGFYLIDGEFNFSGGEISGNFALSGGGVYNSGGSLKMNGGVIYGNKAGTGSGVYNAGAFTVMGGSALIAANNDFYANGNHGIKVEAPLEAQKAAVITPGNYNDANSVLVDVDSIADDFQAAAQINKFSLTPNASGEIYFLKSSNPGRGKIVSAAFSRGSAGLTLYYQDLQTALAEAAYSDEITVLKNAEDVGEDVFIQKFITLKPAAGKNIKLTASFTAESGGALRLSGNSGGVLTLTPSNSFTSAVSVENGGSFILAGGAVISGGAAQRSVSLARINSGGVFRMDGGELKEADVEGYGGAVYNEAGGTFTITGGSISGAKADRDGGAIYNAGTFTMTGGSISNNTAYSNGGAVFNDNGALTMTGGSISGNNASSGGGAVYNKKGTFTIRNGEVSANKASNAGGMVYNEGGAIEIAGGAVSGNGAGNAGGAVFNDNGTLAITGGSISGNTANSNGGAVFNTLKFTMTGGEISGNTASVQNGGAVYNAGTFTMSDGEISGGNKAKKSGGAIYNEGTLEITGGSISGAKADLNGGAVYNIGMFTMSGGKLDSNSTGEGGAIYNAGMFTMTGGFISNNNSTNGGGVFNEDGTFTMEGGEISGNNAGSGGGGVYNKKGTFTIRNGDVSANRASNAGGAVYNEKGTIEMTGGAFYENMAYNNGGGVFNEDETFTMEGGSIFGNTGYNSGGAVFNTGTFTMTDGEVSGNTAYQAGGAIYNTKTFTMTGGYISGNSASIGGAICNNSGAECAIADYNFIAPDNDIKL